ncbi:MAG: Seryl-tRNA synthetase N-terminal domain [Marinobacter excellens HL-55]|uniref:Seryl-tRNA synthetase N-terminal domain n=1 Tax=Marinobacter excellens HL-55 TaxID=1305731 RepID=A0A0P8B7T2_9GAMM|nr:MAG: Seryl-tRNA synthetase N-terminal domain [Marinobacter excellens HL-55]
MSEQIAHLSEVEALQARIEDVQGQLEEARAEQREANTGIAQAYADGKEDELSDLTARRRAAADKEEGLIPALEILKGKLRDGLESACKAEAGQRLGKIAREHGRNLSDLGKDAARVQEAAAALTEALQRADERYVKTCRLENEAAVIAMRWPDLTGPSLTAARPITQSRELQTELNLLIRKIEAGASSRPAAPRPAVITASATPAEQEAARLEGLAEYLKGKVTPLYRNGGDPRSEGARLVQRAGIAQ